MIPGNLEALRGDCSGLTHYAIVDSMLGARNAYYTGTATALVAAVGTAVVDSNAKLLYKIVCFTR